MNVAVLIFARAPQPGACKTRLIPALGAEGAAELHRRLVRRTLEIAVASGVGPVSLWCAGDADDPFFRDCEAEYGVARQRQCAGDLGARMHGAFVAAHGPALLAGSDIAGLRAEDLRACAEALSTHDAVFLPAEDGGYGLAGLNVPCPELFEGMSWSHARVMDDTRERLRRQGATWCEPRIVFDVDEPDDLARLDADLLRDLI